LKAQIYIQINDFVFGNVKGMLESNFCKQNFFWQFYWWLFSCM